jgi:DNA-binding NarL/FixJ family response regulator
MVGLDPLAPTVLIVEDAESERAVMRDLLEAEGIAVVAEAGDGAEGVDRAIQTRPDVVLMDLRMPAVGGIEATRLIKEALPNTQVIILTVYEGPLPERSAEEVGAYAYLVKGCSPTLIRDVIIQARNYKTGLETRAGES